MDTQLLTRRGPGGIPVGVYALAVGAVAVLLWHRLHKASSSSSSSSGSVVGAASAAPGYQQYNPPVPILLGTVKLVQTVQSTPPGAPHPVTHPKAKPVKAVHTVRKGKARRAASKPHPRRTPVLHPAHHPAAAHHATPAHRAHPPHPAHPAVAHHARTPVHHAAHKLSKPHRAAAVDTGRTPRHGHPHVHPATGHARTVSVAHTAKAGQRGVASSLRLPIWT